ncbi:glycosyltransferase family 4 protein [Rubrobacter indicoceani]|uniref:glycosyltransferase family 4 protein n=1 Tax=Rubrobacter indicoceani TaxID=2051957 RepID=UPI000E5AC5D9|nr:glycosyltransferase family 4 protein [Rubrobacter indicoceani]
MRLWHVGARPSPEAVDGVGMVVWQVAREQALLGHEVALILDEEPDEAARAFASGCGLDLITLPPRLLRYSPAKVRGLLKTARPDLVHMHKTFVPQQLSLTRLLVKQGIPYVITPHGGVNHRRSRNLKKTAYTWLIERARFARAAAITTVAPLEEVAVRRVVPDFARTVRWVPNPVDTRLLDGHEWHGDLAAKTMMYLGRFHVINKGIDTLVEISRSLPQTTLDLYGTPHPQTAKLLAGIKSTLPANVRFNGPVSGPEKARLLAASSLYIQTSRWEGFSISVAEAMYVGVPCVVCDTPHPSQMVHHAEVMKERGLGLVLPTAPGPAAEMLAASLDEPSEMIRSAERARDFARRNFSPKAAALGYLEVYEESFASSL